MLKFLIVTFLAVGALAEYQVPETDPDYATRIYLNSVCKKNVTNKDFVNDLLIGVNDLSNCSSSINFRPVTVQKEIEEAKPNGAPALHKLFKKYCDKSPQLKSCVQSLNNAHSPCLDEDEVMLLNYTGKLIDFACYNDGERIAMFIAEGGLECFNLKLSGLETCLVKTSLKENYYCTKFKKMSTCVVRELQGCDTPTAANMADSLLNIIMSSCPKA